MTKDVYLDGEKIGEVEEGTLTEAERKARVFSVVVDHAEKRYPAPAPRLIIAWVWSFDCFMDKARLRGRPGLRRWQETWRETEDAFVLDTALARAWPPASQADPPEF